MNDFEGAALLAAINENLNDLAPRLIYSDWLEENGRLIEARAWRENVVRWGSFSDFINHADDLYDLGRGVGEGENGNGTGGGSGDGSGYGHWIELGEPSESGDGDGYGVGYAGLEAENDWISTERDILEGRPVIGKQMLIWCGRGFAWIGHVDEMYAPGCYKLSNAGMLCRTGPDSWMAVASGVARDNYVYRHAPDGIVYTGPELHGAVEWKGELPGRDMR